MQGFHAENLLFVVEEASGIDDIVFEVASGALSTPGAIIVMAGNPTRTSGYFYRAFHGNRANWYCMHVPCADSSRVSPDCVRQMRDEYGEHSNAYRVRVLGEFPLVDDASVIPLAMIEAAVSRDVEPTMHSVVWGVDIARYGDDRCALVKRRGNTILEPAKVWSQQDTMHSVGVISREFFGTSDHEQPSSINVDVIGVGAGVVDRLNELGLPVFGINVGESPEQPERFARLRDELWWAARDWFRAAACKIPADDTLLEPVRRKLESLESFMI